ncbi:MAG TPA: hypothetical protein VFR58_00555 [Flavisolibacter sp.]|nr:hypothetical protein [Flavisolibacter sp.]
MTEGSELRRLKSELGGFSCLNYEDLRFFTRKIAGHIRSISAHHPAGDAFFKDYVNDVVLQHLAIIEAFVNNIDIYQGREEFVSKSLKYHFNCIIDSYTYATVSYRHSS